MTMVEDLAGFVEQAGYGRVSPDARQRLRVCMVDALGCAIGALGAQPLQAIRDYTAQFNDSTGCALIGGGRAAADRAAFHNAALVRYLDFNDSFLAPGETCHPSDNLGAILAAAEYAGGSGAEFIGALAVAYQVQCRLSEVAPVRGRGFDHTTQGAYAVAAGAGKALGLTADQTANALAMAGTALNALRVTRTGALSHWKGLAFPFMSMCALQAVFLARAGITGPREVFEGNKGFMESISGRFEIDWRAEDLERVKRVILKKHNAEVHSQSAIEAVLELKRAQPFQPEAVERIEIETFDVAYKIIGGGEEGDKTVVRTKEEADHSLPYIIAAAILDGQVMPEQYLPQRILRNDVQDLLRRVVVRPAPDLSREFPDAMPARIRVCCRNGPTLTREQRDYEGFHTRPMSWESVAKKFNLLAAPYTTPELRRRLLDAVADLEHLPVSALTRLLAEVRSPHLTSREESSYEPAKFAST